MPTHTPPSHCPYCNYLIDAATGLGEDNTPGPGDVSVCLKCGQFLKYGPELKMEKLSVIEFNELNLVIQTQLLKVQQIILFDPKMMARRN